MSEHIKTGEEITKLSNEGYYSIEDLKWVSLSELKKYSGYTVDAALDAMEKT